ncbi:MAG: hypothetical protein BIFFINMI_03025 [Phycisphaerae bacterium]|nr:hypothetical protein [Phycisphaerae bacterium]
MATEKPRNEEEQVQPESEAAEKKPRNPKLVTALWVGGVLLGEAVLIVLVMLLNGSPGQAQAKTNGAGPAGVLASNDCEELIVEGKAPNTKRGVTFLYRYEIYAYVSQDELDTVKKVMEKRKATIESTVREVIARMGPDELDKEPELTTLRRLLQQEFEGIFGEGKIKKIVVSNWIRLRADY